MFKLFKKDEGFTLVELMVVVLIIGILVAIAIPIFNNATKQSKLKACDANARTLTGAVSQYQAAEGKLPTELSELKPDYIADIPVCPVDATDYEIATTGVVTPHDHTTP